MIGYFIGQIEKAQTLLKADYRSVTVSASISPTSLYVSVKSPYWTHEMEWREGDAPDIPLSEWICREVRLIHAPDILITKSVSRSNAKSLRLNSNDAT